MLYRRPTAADRYRPTEWDLLAMLLDLWSPKSDFFLLCCETEHANIPEKHLSSQENVASTWRFHVECILPSCLEHLLFVYCGIPDFASFCLLQGFALFLTSFTVWSVQLRNLIFCRKKQKSKNNSNLFQNADSIKSTFLIVKICSIFCLIICCFARNLFSAMSSKDCVHFGS